MQWDVELIKLNSTIRCSKKPKETLSLGISLLSNWDPQPTVKANQSPESYTLVSGSHILRGPPHLTNISSGIFKNVTALLRYNWHIQNCTYLKTIIGLVLTYVHIVSSSPQLRWETCLLSPQYFLFPFVMHLSSPSITYTPPRKPLISFMS